MPQAALNSSSRHDGVSKHEPAALRAGTAETKTQFGLDGPLEQLLHLGDGAHVRHAAQSLPHARHQRLAEGAQALERAGQPLAACAAELLQQLVDEPERIVVVRLLGVRDALDGLRESIVLGRSSATFPPALANSCSKCALAAAIE